MIQDIKTYLKEVNSHLHLDPSTANRVIGELQSHFHDRISDLQAAGHLKETAAKEAMASLGRPRVVARLMYEAHSRGSWLEAIGAALPHIAVGYLFSAHLWRHIVLTPLILAIFVTVTLVGWWRGKPSWLYSWIGYCLFPLLLAGYLSRGLFIGSIDAVFAGVAAASQWLLLIGLALFYAVSAWLIWSTTVRVVSRDWTLASLMLVPLPLFGVWLFATETLGPITLSLVPVPARLDEIMARILLVFAVGSFLSIRIRIRFLKLAIPAGASLVTAIILTYTYWQGVGFFVLLGLGIALFLVIVSPGILSARRRREPVDENLSALRDSLPLSSKCDIFFKVTRRHP